MGTPTRAPMREGSQPDTALSDGVQQQIKDKMAGPQVLANMFWFAKEPSGCVGWGPGMAFWTQNWQTEPSSPE